MASNISDKKKLGILICTIELCLLISISSCSKLIEVNTPTTSISANNVYSNTVTATAVLTGIYTSMSSASIQSTDLSSIGFITGLSADELTLYRGAGDTRLRAYYQNNLKVVTSYYDFWTSIYQKIYVLNLSIEGLSNSTTLPINVKQQLLGESKFMRAFCYFYLVNLYGDVPLAVTSNYSTNSTLERSPSEYVWKQIISDLKDAKNLLSTDYLDATLQNKTSERIRPTRWAASALLARSFLYTKDWQSAISESTEIISNSNLYGLDSLNKSFLVNNREAIWQLQPVNNGSNTEDAKSYIITSSGPSDANPVFLSTLILNSFELADQRKKVWIDTVTVSGVRYSFPSKYKAVIFNAPVTEYNTVLRLGEQFLIRAEAKTQLNNLTDACNDLNKIRNRAKLQELHISEKTKLLDTIYHERQVELFTEWGHRWFDIKRNQTVNSIMALVTPQKGGTWNANWQLYPILSNDILVNSNLKQNTGY